LAHRKRRLLHHLASERLLARGRELARQGIGG
jgi:hypothetical protein